MRGEERSWMTESLILSPAAVRTAGRRLGELLAAYEESIDDRRVFPAVNGDALRAMLNEPLPEDGRPLDALFNELEDVIVPNSTQVAHPRFLAYVLASPASVAVFAEAVAAALNQNCNLWTLSPAANVIEQTVLSWFRDLFAMDAGGGIFTSGGSMANLSALMVARDTGNLDEACRAGLQRNQKPMVVYTSEEAHNSIDKAATILGLGTENVVRIPVDDRFRLRMDFLRDAVARDRAGGKHPFCVVASAGTVTTGAIDPLDEVADYCHREDLWFHVDGAYGAFAVLSQRLTEDLAPSGRADSLSLDPHKLLFMPLEAGCVLFRDSRSWRDVFSFVPDYLAMPDDPMFLHFAEYGPQLSRSFKALKVWWCLRAHGRRAYAAAIDKVLDLAAYMGEQIDGHPNLELAAPVTLTAVCFNVNGLDDHATRRLIQDLVSSGVAFLGPARVRGRVCVRACFTNLRTSYADVDAILDEVVALASRD